MPPSAPTFHAKSQNHDGHASPEAPGRNILKPTGPQYLKKSFKTIAIIVSSSAWCDEAGNNKLRSKSHHINAATGVKAVPANDHAKWPLGSSLHHRALARFNTADLGQGALVARCFDPVAVATSSPVSGRSKRALECSICTEWWGYTMGEVCLRLAVSGKSEMNQCAMACDRSNGWPQDNVPAISESTIAPGLSLHLCRQPYLKKKRLLMKVCRVSC